MVTDKNSKHYTNSCEKFHENSSSRIRVVSYEQMMIKLTLFVQLSIVNAPKNILTFISHTYYRY
jgi:hypothetical protein